MPFSVGGSQNPRHTFQSWRERWIYRYEGQRDAAELKAKDGEQLGLVPEAMPAHSFTPREEPPPSRAPIGNTPSPPPSGPPRLPSQAPDAPDAHGFTGSEFALLLRETKDIVNVEEDLLDQAWDEFAKHVRLSFSVVYLLSSTSSALKNSVQSSFRHLFLFLGIS